MTSFEYLSVFVAVVLGLAVTRLVSSVGKSIRHRETVRRHWVHSTWALNVLLYVSAVWWGLFTWNQLDAWNYFFFVFILVYSIALYLLADVLYPDEFGPGLDLEEHFVRHRRWFFAILLFALLLDIPETYLKEAAGLRAVPRTYWIHHGVWLIVATTGIIASNRRILSVLPILFLLSGLTFIGWNLVVLIGGG